MLVGRQAVNRHESGDSRQRVPIFCMNLEIRASGTFNFFSYMATWSNCLPNLLIVNLLIINPLIVNPLIVNPLIC
jgi:hypothetical protein